MPVDNGVGWDGQAYLNIAVNGLRGIEDSQRINRIMPSMLVREIFLLFNISFTAKSIILAFQILNYVTIVLCVIIWDRIIKGSLGAPVYLLSMASLVLSYGIMKFSFYYPILTYTFGFFLSTVLLWGHVNNKRWLILSVLFVGIFNIPIIALMAAALLVFPKENIAVDETHKSFKICISIIAGLIFTTLGAILIYSNPMEHRGIDAGIVTPLMIKLTIPSLLVTWFLFTAGIYYLVLPVSMSGIKEQIFKRRTFILGGMVIVAFLLLGASTRYIINSNEIPIAHFYLNFLSGKVDLSFLVYFANILLNCNRYPLGNLLTHSLFYGPVILLMALNWKTVTAFAYSEGLGMWIVLCMAFIHSFDAESVHIITYVPFIVYITFFSIKFNFADSKSVISVFLLLTLCFSRIYLNINTFPTKYAIYNYCFNCGASQYTDKGFYDTWLLIVVH